jgi:hypothetical protein
MKKNRPHFSDIQIVTRQLNVIVYTENNNWAQHLLRPALVILDISLSDHKQLKKACYFLITQGFHLKPVATEIQRLHFTLPPATFYVSRIKKKYIYSQSRYRDNDQVFYFYYQSLIIITTIDLLIVNNASQTGRRVNVFHWSAKVWYPCMAWTNFIDRPKTSRPWLYLTKHHKMSKRKLSCPDQFHRQMANKRKERYFWNIICSIIWWYKIKVTDNN